VLLVHGAGNTRDARYVLAAVGVHEKEALADVERIGARSSIQEFFFM
jgi:hypothetical protein